MRTPRAFCIRSRSFATLLGAALVVPALMTAEATSPDDEFLSALREGTFTICKVAYDSDEVFPFRVDATVGAVTTTTQHSLMSGQCEDVYVATGGDDFVPADVTMTELVPDGYQVDRVFVWNLEGEVVTSHEYPAGTESISGTLNDRKSGCVGVFYNSMTQEEEGACWMTGGGVKFEAVVGRKLATTGRGPVDTVGGVVFPSCSSEPSDGGQWNHVAHSAQLHLNGKNVQAVRCGNVPGIDPGSESPVTPFNFIEFLGTGTLSGIKGNKFGPEPVMFFGRVEDRNEPGNEQSAKSGEDIDRYFLHVFDQNGTTLLLVDEDGDENTIDPLTITGGNFQLHSTSCD